MVVSTVDQIHRWPLNPLTSSFQTFITWMPPFFHFCQSADSKTSALAAAMNRFRDPLINELVSIVSQQKPVQKPELPSLPEMEPL